MVYNWPQQWVSSFGCAGFPSTSLDAAPQAKVRRNVPPVAGILRHVGTVRVQEGVCIGCVPSIPTRLLRRIAVRPSLFLELVAELGIPEGGDAERA